MRTNTEKAVKRFEKFCKLNYKEDMQSVINEIKRLAGEQKERVIFDTLQDFVNYLSEEINPNTAKLYFAVFKPYFAYVTYSKIHSEDIKENINFPRVIEEEPYPLSIDEIKELLKHSNFERKASYLTSISSGIRIQELCKLRKRDFDLSKPRFMIKLPGAYTKNRKVRRTFVSFEAMDNLKPILDKKKDDELVFTNTEDSETAAGNERSVFHRIRESAGFDNLRYDSGMHKITIHSFRSFFITKAERVHEGLGHFLAGHGKRYLKKYERYTDSELLEYYLKIEPELIISNENRLKVESQSKDEKIKNMESQNNERLHVIEKKLSDFENIMPMIKKLLEQAQKDIKIS